MKITEFPKTLSVSQPRLEEKVECSRLPEEQRVKNSSKIFLFFFIFILLSRESDGGAVLWTNLHPLRSYPVSKFEVVKSCPDNLLLVSVPPSRISIASRLIQGRYNVTRVVLNHDLSILIDVITAPQTTRPRWQP